MAWTDKIIACLKLQSSTRPRGMAKIKVEMEETAGKVSRPLWTVDLFGQSVVTALFLSWRYNAGE
jgi:hypothetical protein